MKLSPIALSFCSAALRAATPLFAASLFVTSFAVVGCSVDAADPDASEDGTEETGTVEDELAAAKYVGTWEYRGTQSLGYVGIAELQLSGNGKYTAQVDMPPSQGLCIHFPCTMPESGTWNSYTAAGASKIRLKPQGKPARIYTVVLNQAQKTLRLSRLGKSSKLFKQPTLSCANVRCMAGTTCQMVSGSPECVPNHPPPLNFCVKTGCSGHICAPQHMVSTCEWQPDYACYQQATCEVQANGSCGFTQTPELAACLAAN